MSTLTIINDADHKQDFIITDCSIQIDEADELLFLKFDVGDSIIQYRIAADTREPDIHAINEFIEKAIATPVTIFEYLVRDYITIVSTDARKQLTAQRI